MNPRFRDGIQYTHRPARGDSLAPLHYGVPREIFTKRPLWRRTSLRGWTLLAGLAGSTAFYSYLIWGVKWTT